MENRVRENSALVVSKNSTAVYGGLMKRSTMVPALRNFKISGCDTWNETVIERYNSRFVIIFPDVLEYLEDSGKKLIAWRKNNPSKVLIVVARSNLYRNPDVAGNNESMLANRVCGHKAKDEPLAFHRCWLRMHLNPHYHISELIREHADYLIKEDPSKPALHFEQLAEILPLIARERALTDPQAL